MTDNLNKIFSFLFTEIFIKKLIAYWVLILIFYIFRGFLWIFLLIFIFSYLFFSSAKFLKWKIEFYILKYLKNKKILKFFKKFFNLDVIVTIEYIIFISILFYIISHIIPDFKSEIDSVVKWKNNWIISNFNHIKINLLDFIYKIDPKDNLHIVNYFNNFFKDIDLKSIWHSVLNSLGVLWKIFVHIFIALLFSYVFILDRKRLSKYLNWIRKSSFKFIYLEYKNIFKKIVLSFWLVLKAQSLIAIVNALLTTIWLLIIAWIYWEATFPFLVTITLIVFLFSYIPVLWVFLSSIPILIIWYTYFGGFQIIFEIISLVLLVHAVEAYYLNPKIVSSFFDLPISLTFIILFISEQLLWVAWLLIWTSLFYFIVSILEDININLNNRKKIKKIEHKILKRVKKSA